MEQLFDEQRRMSMNSEQLEDQEFDKFTKQITRDWGEQETQLRSAIYVSFLRNKDVELLRRRQTKRDSHGSFGPNDSRTNSMISSTSERMSDNQPIDRLKEHQSNYYGIKNTKPDRFST